MDQVLNVIIPPDTNNLLSVEEVKTALGIPIGDQTQDAQILLLIEQMSNGIARKVGRVLGYQSVIETFLGANGHQRLYLSQWPVRLEDIESFSVNDVDVMLDTDWILEESTGTLFRTGTGTWNGTVVVGYSGGYMLPDEAPAGLKQAGMILTRDNYYQAQRGDSSIRSLSHKESRVQYFSPDQMVVKTGSGGGSSSSDAAVEGLLVHFRRVWI